MHPPDFQLRPSQRLLALFGVLLLISFSAILILPINAGLKFLMCMLISAYIWHICRQYALLKSKEAIVRIIRLNDGRWRLVTANGKGCIASLSGQSTITAHLSILNFRFTEKPGRQNCIIAGDSLDGKLYQYFLMTVRFQ